MTISSPSVPQCISHFSGELLVHCKYKMASLMAQVTALLSQLFATNNMGTDDLDNPTRDDLNKTKVLDRCSSAFLFSSDF